jgi:hypothetical protein
MTVVVAMRSARSWPNLIRVAERANVVTVGIGRVPTASPPLLTVPNPATHSFLSAHASVVAFAIVGVVVCQAELPPVGSVVLTTPCVSIPRHRVFVGQASGMAPAFGIGSDVSFQSEAPPGSVDEMIT